MTTHETRPEMDTTTDPAERATQQPMDHAPTVEPPTAETATPPKDLERPRSGYQELFVVDDLSGLKARWTEVQAAFVDDPRECVQKADGLVSDVVDKLTAGFAQARSRLEEQWDRGEEVSTEDLRIALKRYREFFERLLAV